MKITVDEKNFLCSYTIADAYGEFEMPDEYVETLVALIREKGTTDIDELGVYTSHTAIYELLREEINSIRYDSACDHEMREAIFNAECEWDVDTDELIDYCRQNCGFTDSYFDEEDEEDLGFDDDDDDGDFGEEAYAEAQREREEEFRDRFWAWYRHYVATAPYEDISDLFYELYDTECECDFGFGYDTDPFIPQQIIDLANFKKK
jgi:hypothetical protein